MEDAYYSSSAPSSSDERQEDEVFNIEELIEMTLNNSDDDEDILIHTYAPPATVTRPRTHDDGLRPWVPAPIRRRNPVRVRVPEGGGDDNEIRLIDPRLLEMVHQYTRDQDNNNAADEDVHRPEVLETWLYNWQTKERKIPQAMVVAGEAIKHIEKAFQHLKDFHAKLLLVSSDLQPSSLVAVDKLATKAIRTHSGIIRELEEKINAIRLYWFPETVEQFKVGAYKSVRQYVQEMHIEQDDIDILVCSTCLESMSARTDGHENNEGTEIIPIVFRRRCQINPLLARKCDLQNCRCTLPSICLDCALDHLLRNGLHEGKSSVRCPACRGEVCIYDVQEIKLISRSPPLKTTIKPETTGVSY